MIRRLLLLLGFTSFALCVYWTWTMDGRIEPITALIAAVSTIVSLWVKDHKDSSAGEQEADHLQSNVLSGNNETSAKKVKGKTRQTNFLSFGNTQKIESLECYS